MSLYLSPDGSGELCREENFAAALSDLPVTFKAVEAHTLLYSLWSDFLFSRCYPVVHRSVNIQPEPRLQSLQKYCTAVPARRSVVIRKALFYQKILHYTQKTTAVNE